MDNGFDSEILLNSVGGGVENLMSIILIGFFTVFFASFLGKFFDKFYKSSTKNLRVDRTHYIFMKHASVGLVYAFGLSLVIYSIPSLRAVSVSLLAGAGVLAVVVGFASQAAFSNIISGVFLAIFKPISVGDRVKVGTTITGEVEDITLRHTIIRTFENKRVIIPNSVLSNEIIENSNLVDEKVCKFIDMGISYDSSIDKAMEVMVEEALKHPSCFDNRTKKEVNAKVPQVMVKVVGFGDSSVNLRAYVWVKDPKSAFLMGCDLYKSIKERFDEEGIEIPYPYRTIVYKKGGESV